jgi:hypothetical protein
MLLRWVVFDGQEGFSTMKLDSPESRIFQEQTVPAGTRLAGWALLTSALSTAAPVREPSCVSDQHVRGSQRPDESWTIYDKRYWPGDTFADHLSFALRHETLDLLVLKRVFEAAPQNEVESFVRAAPTGIPARRAWLALTGGRFGTIRMRRNHAIR